LFPAPPPVAPIRDYRLRGGDARLYLLRALGGRRCVIQS
jgi:hypothetical protein